MGIADWIFVSVAIVLGILATPVKYIRRYFYLPDHVWREGPTVYDVLCPPLTTGYEQWT